MRAMCKPWRVTNTPVCVVGLGLIGGSVMRAAAAAGREVFGYNRSIDAVQAAKFDGFDATENLDKTLARAAHSKALIVLAVPVPALPLMLGHIRDRAPQCPLTDVTSVKGAILEEVQSFGLLERFVGGHPMAGTAHSGWAAGNPRLFIGAPWVISVDDLVEGGHAARIRYDSFSRPEIVTIVIGEEKWREELAAAGRAGGVIRSALPALGSRG